MKSQESQEDYLETILMLSETSNEVHAVDVANELNFSKASVSVAMKKLRAAGYAVVSENGAITLTKSGEEIASAVYERHKTLSTFFEGMGVSHEIASEDACRIEHYLSEETYTALINHIKRHKQLEKNCN